MGITDTTITNINRINNYMFLSLFIGSFVIFVMALYFFKKQGPCLLLLLAFSIFYFNLRGWLLFSGNYSKFAYLNPSTNYAQDDSFVFASFCISILMSITFLGYVVGSKVLKINDDLNKGEYSPLSACIIFTTSILGYFIYPPSILISGVLFFYIYLHQSTHKFFFLTLSIVLLTVVILFITDDRRDFLAILLIPVFYMLHIQKIFSIRFIAISSAALVGIIYISIALRSGDDSFEILFANKESLIKILEVETDFSIVYDDLLFFFSEYYNGKVDLLYGTTLLKPFMYLIPREIFIDKPETLSVLYSKVFNPSFAYSGGSQPITFIGDYFWNLGFFSIVLLFIFGIILSKVDGVYLKNRSNSRIVIFTAIFFSFLFSLLRGPFDTFIISYAFILLYCFSFINIKMRKNV
ncbi:MAG: O-antigen polymerase [Pseudoalteromonas sp.]